MLRSWGLQSKKGDVLSFFKECLFIFETERESVCVCVQAGEAKRKKGRGRIPSRVRAASRRAQCGARTHEPWAETKVRQLTDWAARAPQKWDVLSWKGVESTGARKLLLELVRALGLRQFLGCHTWSLWESQVSSSPLPSGCHITQAFKTPRRQPFEPYLTLVP